MTVPPAGGTPPPSPERLGGTALALLAARSADASICPSDVVRRLWRDASAADEPADGWRAWMPAVRGVAADLAAAGILRLTRGDRDLTPDDARDGRGGPIRLRRGPRFPAPFPGADTDTDTDPAG